jgi:geranylgeranyl pyrophosphate synthase
VSLRAEARVRLAERERVVATVMAFGERTIREPRHRAMVAAAVEFDRNELPAMLTIGGDLAPVVYAAASGIMTERVDLAALTYVLWVAFDVLDDIADGDAAAKWPQFGSAELGVMATSLIAATAHELAATLDDDRGLREMADGQIADLADTGRDDVTLDCVAAAVRGKTGAECALFAGLGATLANVAPERVAAFEAFGTEYGIANQYVTDLLELFGDDVCRDVTNGTRTFPIVAHLARLAGEERAAFLRLLDGARRDPVAASAVRATIGASPALRATVFQILVHLNRARAALRLAQPSDEAAPLLEQFLVDLDPTVADGSGRGARVR